MFQAEQLDFSKLLHGLVKIDTWGFSMWLYGFVKNHLRISLSSYMDLSKFINGFHQVVTWICQNQSWSLYFSPFAKQNQAEVE